MAARSEEKGSFLGSVLSFLKTFAVSVAIMLSILAFVRPSRVNGTSMEPTYHDGQYVLVRTTKNLKRNDVAVLWSSELDKYVIKRVVGVAGDTIQVDGRGLYRNGQLIYESYVNEDDWPQVTEETFVVVGSGEVFVMGDNRKASCDSRELGLFDVEDVMGRVILG